MDNKTILIPSTEQKNDSLTNFSNEERGHYNDFKLQTMNFVKNRTKKNHIPYYNENINYLISESSTLFKQLSIIQESYDIGSIHDVRQTFIDHINEYNQNLAQYDIEESMALVSRYILCTFIDESINTTFFGRDNNWSSNSLLSIFHNESYGGENFFRLLDKFLKAPAKYIFILELMYVCLSLGFEGRYRVNNKNKHELTIIRDGLYKQIKIIQGRESLNFYTKQEASKMKNRLFYLVSYQTIALSTFILLTIIYTGFSFALVEQDNNFGNIISEKDKNLTYLNEKNFNLENFKKENNE